MALSAGAFRDDPQMEFPFREQEFRFLADLLHQKTGIVLNSSKMNMVYTRLARRLRELRFSSFAEYCDLIKGPDGEAEMGTLINALTTNLTRFFREPHHFDHVRSQVLADFKARAGSRSGRLRIWSAGCSSGEEPYTLAMLLADELPAALRTDAKILATDLDTNMVATGKRGIYAASAFEDMPRQTRDAHFEAHGAGQLAARQHLRDLITFKQLNLMEHWPLKGPFDAIFCRNVMIYFDNPTKAELVRRFHDLLAPGGFLYIGHSESLIDNKTSLTIAGRTIYRKAGA